MDLETLQALQEKRKMQKMRTNEDKCLLLQTKNARIKHDKGKWKANVSNVCSFTDIKQHAANLSSK